MSLFLSFSLAVRVPAHKTSAVPVPITTPDTSMAVEVSTDRWELPPDQRKLGESVKYSAQEVSHANN